MLCFYLSAFLASLKIISALSTRERIFFDASRSISLPSSRVTLLSSGYRGNVSKAVPQHWIVMPLNKKKSPKAVSLLRLGQPIAPSWLSYTRSAKAVAKVAGSLFSVKSATPMALLPEEPLTSEVQGLLNSATNVIECATGGHGRCANSVCLCRCHKSRTRARTKRRASI
jgi:hypothetical protein